MYKIISRSLMTLMIVGKTLSAEFTEHEKFTSDPKAYYANHPANQTDKTEKFVTVDAKEFGKDLVVRFSMYLPLPDALTYLQVCKKIALARDEILVNQLGHIYAARKLNIQDAFFTFPHPEWAPWNLPFASLLKLHRCYLDALRIDASVVNAETSQSVQRKFSLLYSSACGGHKGAAEEAGVMLLNPLYNNVITVLMRWSDLVPEAKEWDLCRLNRPMTDNPNLSRMMNSMESFFAKYDHLERFTKAEQTFIEERLKELTEFDETSETKAIGIFFNEMILFMKKGIKKDDCYPIQTIAFVRSLGYVTPLLQQFAESNDEEDGAVQVQLPVEIPSFNVSLNVNFLEPYCENVLRKYVYTETRIVDANDPHKRTFLSEPKYTKEAQGAMVKYIEAQRVVLLLGGQCNYIPSRTLSINHQANIEDFMAASNTYTPSEDRIHVFLYHLVLTRNSALHQFNEVEFSIRCILGEDKGQGPNPERLGLLRKAFPNFKRK